MLKLTINKSCGFHVHISKAAGKAFTPEELRVLYANVVLCEMALDLMVPKSRRADSNKYCK